MYKDIQLYTIVNSIPVIFIRAAKSMKLSQSLFLSWNCYFEVCLIDSSECKTVH